MGFLECACRVERMVGAFWWRWTTWWRNLGATLIYLILGRWTSGIETRGNDRRWNQMVESGNGAYFGHADFTDSSGLIEMTLFSTRRAG